MPFLDIDRLFFHLTWVKAWLISFVTLFTFNSFISFAQFPEQLQFKKFGLEQGFPSNTAKRFEQDMRNDLWVATDKGLILFDGVNHFNFDYIISDSDTIHLNEIKDIVKINPAAFLLHVGTKGLVQLNTELRHFRHRQWSEFGLSSDTIIHIKINQENRLFVNVLNSGIYEVNLVSKHSRLILPIGNYFRDEYTNFLTLEFDNGGNLWTGAWGKGLLRLDKESKKLSVFDLDNKSDFQLSSTKDFNSLYLHTLKFDKNDRLWIGGFLGLSWIDTKTFEKGCFQWNNLQGGTGRVVKILFDRDEQSLWCVSSSGLIRVNKNNGQYELYKSDLAAVSGINYDDIVHFVNDNRGGIWFGTTDEGLAYTDKKLFPFSYIHNTHDISNDLPLEKIHWVRVKRDEKVAVFKTYNNRFYFKDLVSNNIEDITMRIVNALPENCSESISKLFFTESDDGRLWFRVYGCGFIGFDLRKSNYYAFTDLAIGKDKTNAGFFTQIKVIDERFVWVVCAWSGIWMLDLEKGVVIEQKSLKSSACDKLFPLLSITSKGQSDSVFYVFGNGGICERNLFTGESQLLLSAAQGEQNVFRGVSLYNDSLAIISSNFHVLKFNLITNYLDTLLSHMYLERSGVLDSLGYFWITDSDGTLHCLEIHGQTHITYGKNQNFRINSALVNGYFRQDQIILNSNNTNAVVSASQIRNQKFIGTDYHFSYIRVNRKKLQTAKNTKIALNPNSKIIELFFAPEEITSLESHFAFRINKESWIDNGQNTAILLQNLAPGDYEIEVAPVVDGEKLTEEIITLNFELKPFFWQTNWFRLVLFLLAILAVLGFNKWRNRQLIRKNQKLEMLVGKRTEQLNIEKEKVENLLHNILPEEVAQELKDSGQSEARIFNNVSVLFTDFVGFTTISEQMSPAELVATIHEHFTAFDKVIEKHQLEKIKTIGDAYMAVCGLPQETDEHAVRTTLAALEIVDYMNNKPNPLFKLRVGINSGSVVAGIVGLKKFQYDIWGDTVNTASRMESNGGVGQVNVSKSTYELLRDNPLFEFESRGKLNVKGKGDIEMWFVRKSENGQHT